MKYFALLYALFFLVVSVVALVFWFCTAGAQMVATTPCGQSVPCLSQRLKDLQDYRDFLEDQLALAKSLNAELQSRLQSCGPELPPRPEK